METIGARVAHMEGAQAERECNDVLVQKEERYDQQNCTIILKSPFMVVIAF